MDKIKPGAATQKYRILIPELKLDKIYTTDRDGMARVSFSTALQLWSPETPRLYKVIIESETDSITDHIGFRNIEVKGHTDTAKRQTHIYQSCKYP